MMYMKKNGAQETVNIAIVILHYNDIELTTNYIQELKKLNWGFLTYRIIIVDNFSPDGSGISLKAQYKSDSEVVILLNKSNLGFAKGNNIGIRYANEVFQADLVVVSNSDINISDTDFFTKLWQIYIEERPALIGPDIYSLSKKIHQSPISQKVMDLNSLQLLETRISRKIRILKIIQRLHIYNFISLFKRILKGKGGNDSYNFSNKQYNVVLQGAFLVLSKEYLKKHPEGLFPDTFLYMEEHILAFLCKKEKLLTLYTPDLKVFHLDGYSTLKQQSNKCKKYIFELEETKRSCSVFERLILEYRKDE